MIETANLRLVPCSLAHFEAMLRDEGELASLLRVSLAEDWLGFPAAREAMPPSYEYLKSHPSAFGWWTYLIVHAADGTLIGVGGFKGEVSEDGTVEIGYSIAPAYRRRGLATEAARGMIEHAFSHPPVKRVDAHTLPEKNPSTKVLEKVGMRYVGTVVDPDDGEVWRWSLGRESYEGDKIETRKAPADDSAQPASHQP
jgi:RimJ/RimL family protein N-acetyltransferase